MSRLLKKWLLKLFEDLVESVERVERKVSPLLHWHQVLTLLHWACRFRIKLKPVFAIALAHYKVANGKQKLIILLILPNVTRKSCMRPTKLYYYTVTLYYFL